MKKLIRARMEWVVLLVACGLAVSGNAQKQTREETMLGFSPAKAQAEARLEERFLSLPSAEQARKWHRWLTAEPHPAGSARNNELAREIAETWRRQGWEDVVIHRYDVLSSEPREVTLEVTSPIRYTAGLREDPYEADPDTKNPRVRSAYLGFSASGEVTAPVVYAHSGNPEDYELLRRNGIDVRGKIVLVRYSNPYSYRGFKALTAEREGAAALLIYSDPAEDGYARGKVFPEGPWGPESHIQRGAIAYDFMVPGDPLTPGWASVPGAKRIPIEQAVSVPKIMAVVMSWRDAKPILEHLGGTEAPQDWQGALPLKYRFGGEAVRVHLKVDMDTSVKPYYVVEARIRGAELPDEWVILGNHRDAWEFGGVDPSSGTAAMLELSRAFGELKQQGIRPRRTLVICSWDGEEYTLTGSTEWGEQFADPIKQKAVAYLNVDETVSGPNLQLEAVPSLAPLLIEITRGLQDPSGKSLYDAWRESRGRELGLRRAARESELVDIRVGSGSDHTVFLNFLGRPVVALHFDGPYGVYHSMYDDFYWMNRFGDPGYRYHRLMAQLWGTLALRLANAELLPLDFAEYGRSIREFLKELDTRTHLGRRVDLKRLRARAGELEAAGRELNRAVAKALAAKPGSRLDAVQEARINLQLMEVEGNWLNPAGIPGRPWFKHMLYGTRYTYAHLELPGLTEAAEKGDWKIAEEQAGLLERALAKNTAVLRNARMLLESPGSSTP